MRFYLPKRLEDDKKTPIIFFFHGGGFVMGDLDTHDFTCRSICIESRMVVCAVDYSLSPEYKFPYAVQEVKDVINHLPQLKNEFSIDVNNVFVCGDSAGGNLAAVLATVIHALPATRTVTGPSSDAADIVFKVEPFRFSLLCSAITRIVIPNTLLYDFRFVF